LVAPAKALQGILPTQSTAVVELPAAALKHSMVLGSFDCVIGSLCETLTALRMTLGFNPQYYLELKLVIDARAEVMAKDI
jgi:hypothetical protein